LTWSGAVFWGKLYIVITVEINKKKGFDINELMYISSYFHVYIINLGFKEMIPYICMGEEVM
jgi:hypothetical protein